MIKKNVAILFIIAVLITSTISAQEIYQWRNDNRSGIYQETNLLKSWPENGPELLWEFDELGNGYGSPVFTEDRMYINGEIDSVGYTFAFDLDGNLIWKKDYGAEWIASYRGSRSAPTIVDSLIYVSSGLGNITCFNLDGEKKWGIDMLKDLNGKYTMFGHSESLLIDEDRVFLTAGGKDTNVVALNRFTGDIVWINKGLGERPAYNAPNIIKLKKRSIVVTFTAYALLGLDSKTGELLWSHIQDNIPVEKQELGMGDTHSNTILYENGFIYYAAGDGNCGVKLELSPDGKSIKEVWRNKAFDSYMGGIVKIGDYLYGSGTAKKGLKSINVETGEIGNVLAFGNGAVIYADEMLYYYNQRGIVALIKPKPLNMEIVSQFKITKGTKEHFSHPVINKGKLYVRHGNVLMAYSIKQ